MPIGWAFRPAVVRLRRTVESTPNTSYRHDRCGMRCLFRAEHTHNRSLHPIDHQPLTADRDRQRPTRRQILSTSASLPARSARKTLAPRCLRLRIAARTSARVDQLKRNTRSSFVNQVSLSVFCRIDTMGDPCPSPWRGCIDRLTAAERGSDPDAGSVCGHRTRMMSTLQKAQSFRRHRGCRRFPAVPQSWCHAKVRPPTPSRTRLGGLHHLAPNLSLPPKDGVEVVDLQSA